MAKLRKNTDADISAVFSDTAALKPYRNQMVVSVVTRPRPSDSEEKKKRIDCFINASHWAVRILSEPSVKELYLKRVNDRLKNAYTVAVTDYLNAPKIHYISLKDYTGAVGDKIRIKATDDFQVVAVDVTISDKHGKELEAGPAVRYKRKPAIWLYTLTAANADIAGTVVTVKAKDRPGNETEKKAMG